MTQQTTPPGTPPGAATTDSGAIVAMSLAAAAFILSAVIPVGFVPGIPAIVAARRSMARIAASDGALTGRTLDLVAIVLGAIGTVASLVLLVVLVVGR